MTIDQVRLLKGKRKITVLTAYDYPFAALLDQAGIDIILVGDSLANVVLGLESTKEIGMQEMLYHSGAVCRAVKNALVVGDMPYSAYQPDPGQALTNAKHFIETGCAAVKIEWFDRCVEAVSPVVMAGIPVMGHIGLTPQTADSLGGFKVQGRDAESASALIEQAKLLDKAGCFSLVLECVPKELARVITDAVSIPTIGIGAGAGCDGQVLVLYDMLGLFQKYRPKFVKTYADLASVIRESVERYKSDVLTGVFPDDEQSFTMPDEVMRKITGEAPGAKD